MVKERKLKDCSHTSGHHFCKECAERIKEHGMDMLDTGDGLTPNWKELNWCPMTGAKKYICRGPFYDLHEFRGFTTFGDISLLSWYNKTFDAFMAQISLPVPPVYTIC